MREFDAVLRSMTLEFCGNAKHKITPEALFATEGAVFLDVRSATECESVDLRLEHQATLLQIPTEEIPDRFEEIPRDKLVGIFCSAGVRATMVYAYLRARGFEQVRIVPGGYGPVMETVMPGKLWKCLEAKQA